MLSVDELRLGQHTWLPYSTPEERLHALQRFILDGLNRNERVMCAGEFGATQSTMAMLGERGLAALSRGRLVLEDARNTYLRGGRFNANRMIEHYAGATRAALADGYSGVRIAADMHWAAMLKNIDGLVAYEERLDSEFHGMPATVVCEYDRRSFPAPALARIEAAHSFRLLSSVLSFSGELDIANRGAFRRALHQAASQGHDELLIDLRAVTYLDAAAIGAISAAACESGRQIRVRVSPRLMRIFELVKPTIFRDVLVEEAG